MTFSTTTPQEAGLEVEGSLRLEPPVIPSNPQTGWNAAYRQVENIM